MGCLFEKGLCGKIDFGKKERFVLKNSLIAVSCGIGILSSVSMAENPLVSYHYLADPAVFVMDSTFYIIADTDDESGNDGYTIKSYYAFSSEDMQNWTDYGMIFTAGREVDYATGAWAPGAVAKDGLIYIVYPNGASGIGMLSAPNIAGPYTDPVGSLLIGGWGSFAGEVDCDGIAWCFDPAIFVDDDESVYITYGGGNSDTRPYGNNFNLYRLNGLKPSGISLDKNSRVALQGAKESFEASYIHKYKGKYYLTYNDKNQHISYAISDKVSGPYSYQGTFMENPNIDGKNINAYNNNHHGIAEFRGHWYVAYHDRRLALSEEHPASLGVANPEPGYHRSLSIDEFTYDGEKMNLLKFTNEGPKQLKNFNPYKTYPALTSSKQRNVRSRSDYRAGKPVEHVLTPLSTKESWIRVSGVDFGAGALTFSLLASSVSSGNRVEIWRDSLNGIHAGTCEIPQTGSWSVYQKTECEVRHLNGVVESLYLVFKGIADSTMGVKEWTFAAGQEAIQSPYQKRAFSIPGKIEAEDYDVGGQGVSYFDKDVENMGGVYREDEVDVGRLDSALDGFVVGYTEEGEWLEYTVNVFESGRFKLTLNASSGVDGASVKFFVDGKAVTDTIKIPNSGSWGVYDTVSVVTSEVAAGEHVLKVLVTGSHANLDWFVFSVLENFESTGVVFRRGEVLKSGFLRRISEKKWFDLNGRRQAFPWKNGAF